MSVNAFDISGDLGMGRGLKPGSMNDMDSFRNLQQVLRNSPSPPLISLASVTPCLSSPPYKCTNNIKLSKDSLFKRQPQETDELQHLRIEIEMLKQELDSVLQKLHSKQQAIQILQQQLTSSRRENDRLEGKLRWFHETLIKDFNSLQFKVEEEREATREFRRACEGQMKRLLEENQALKVLSEQQEQCIKTACHSREQNSLKDVLKSILSSQNTHGHTTPIDHHQLPDQVECDCFCMELRRCACAKQADQLLRHIKYLSSPATLQGECCQENSHKVTTRPHSISAAHDTSKYFKASLKR